MRLLLAVLALASAVTPSFAHDSWISGGGFRNRSNEWCCGANDCTIVRGVQHVTMPMPGYRLHATSEFVSERDTQPSPDGEYWRCERPNHSLRCFFAPPEGM
jgi:hypothetical protein